MIEELIHTGAGELIKQGSGWIVSIMLGIVCYILDKRNSQIRDEQEEQAKIAQKAVQDQYEKRLTEFREILDVMTNSTHTVSAMHGSLTATTEAINQLAQGFAKLLAEFHSQQARWDDRGGTMAKQLEDIRQRVEQLQRGRVA